MITVHVQQNTVPSASSTVNTPASMVNATSQDGNDTASKNTLLEVEFHVLNA